MNVSQAIRAGAHLEFETRWLWCDSANFIVMENKRPDRGATIIYSGKDLDAATAVLMSGQAQEAQS